MIKSLLVNHIKNNVPDSEIAVLLSGGVDSVSVGLAAESAGKEVHEYSFHLTPLKYICFTIKNALIYAIILLR